jgi:hypothetical protein
MTQQQKDSNSFNLKKPEVQKRYQEELSRYHKQIEKNKKMPVRRAKAY